MIAKGSRFSDVDGDRTGNSATLSSTWGLARTKREIRWEMGGFIFLVPWYLVP